MEPGLHFFALTISLSLGASFAEPYRNPSVLALEKDRSNSNAVCFTPECIRTAFEILENMDQEIEPCDDFYRFACGGFETSTPIPDDKAGISAISLIDEKVQEQVKASIEEPIGPNELRPFTLAKNLYKTCMNTNAIENAGLEPLREILRQLGNWPVVEGANWKEDDFNWMESVYRCQRLGYPTDYFIDFDVDIDTRIGTRHVITLDQASLGLSREYLTNGMEDKDVKAYFEYMIDIAVFLGADNQTASQELRESLQFEINLADISLPQEKRRNSTLLYNPMTITELEKRYPSIDWKQYINNLSPPSIRVDDNEIVIVMVPSFIRDLEQLLRTTPKIVQANYLVWRVARDTVSYLSDDIRNIQLKYGTARTGQTKREDGWKECTDIVARRLSISIGALYVRNYFKQDAKKAAVEMFADIRREFIKIIGKTDWMDEKTRSKALEKAESMSSHIAYPDELFDDEKVAEFHASLELEPDDFLGNIRNLSLFRTKSRLEKLRKPVNKSEWTRHGAAAVVNAWYFPDENAIEIPAGILQEHFFSNERPRCTNYGAMGYSIGHEITHGFDDQGSQYDKDGNLVDWWEPETRAKYLEKAECIIDQYSNYTVESVGLNLNGMNTQGENIADNGGIKEAYFAYKNWVKRNGPEPRLPGLKYTSEQMFWISAANTWCDKYRPEVLKLIILTGVHSPGEFRVRGPFSNMPEFAEDFNCPVGSAMNPKQKCTVW